MSKKKQDIITPSEQATTSTTGTVGNLGLSQLNTTVRGFSGKAAGLHYQQHRGEMAAKRAEFKEKYGTEWKKYYDEWRVEHGLLPHPDCDLQVKSMNEGIYEGDLVHISGDGTGELMLRQYAHLREVYGEAYERLERHRPGDSEAVELLLQWAERTGRWRDLPDCLQDEYCRRVSG